MAEVHEVVPDGDVRLIFGSEENGNSTHILVSPVVLSFGSPEGATLASGTRLDLPLPEDCPEGMLAICEVMHMKTPTYPTPSVDSLLQVALLVDKYDCRAAMCFAMKIWMQSVEGKLLVRDSLNLFIIAYLMDFRKSFSKYGRVLVADTEPEFNLTPPDCIPETLQRAIETLSDSRQQLRKELVSKFEEVIDEECAGSDDFIGACDEDCDYFSTRLYNFMAKLKKTPLWPLTRSMDQSLQNILAALLKFPSEWAEAVSPCDDGLYQDNCNEQTTSIIKD
ncbi:hypothetical protein CBER1_03183 [Cercospora berteroae]|uniref:BTB domain-containing protein n=1 Tax=Cercospora berteroae TaxID=357750 RepID=A0A2S6CL79_9PEZI|nr:hypothetical protein CBER1_03183 [Cercospora berteroae]